MVNLTLLSQTFPQITNQPVNTTVAYGQTATFSVGASGAAPLRYQWWSQSNALVWGTNVPLWSSATLSPQMPETISSW